jgi:predicted O-methyltransferase YrrM
MKLFNILIIKIYHGYAYLRYIYRILNAKRIAAKILDYGAIQKFHELFMLQYVLGDRKFKKIVEIGTGKGGTLYMWLKIADPYATVVSLDLKIQDDAKRIEKFKRKHQHVIFLEKDSQKLHTRKIVQKLFGSQKIDLLFIDADHSYNGVKKDWQLYSPLVKKGGVIIFHDITYKNHVGKLWNEIKTIYDHIEIVMDIKKQNYIYINKKNIKWGTWAGFGVIFK